MKEKHTLMLEKYIKIMFGKRAFYLPRIPANVYCKDANTIYIDMADMDEYVIVDGIRCYYCVTYHADKDTVDTHLKDYTIDGMVCERTCPFSFSLTDREFSYGTRQTWIVVPRRDYSELTSVFLEEHKELNARVVKFLKQHPETFEQISVKEWLFLSGEIDNGFSEHDWLPKSISSIFERKEVDNMPLQNTDHIVKLKKINKEEKIIGMNSGYILRSDAFSEDVELEEVDFQHITQIRSEAFQDCTSLTTISFDESLKHIDSKAFIGCTALQKIIFPSTLKEVEFRLGGAVKISPHNISSKDFIESLQHGYAIDLYYKGEYRDDFWD